MTNKRFTEKEMKQLSTNPYVQSVSEKGITYSDDFKGLFMAEKKNGKFARQIFEDAGFYVEVIGMTHIKAQVKDGRLRTENTGLVDLRILGKGIQEAEGNESCPLKNRTRALKQKSTSFKKRMNC